MRLVSFRVRAYRNTLDSTEVTAQEDVTALVGMNESGKFDNWRPAEVLLCDPTIVGHLSTTTLDNFEQLSERINATESSSAP